MALPSPLTNLSGHARWLYPLGVVVGAIVFGNLMGLGLGLLIVAGGVLGGVIWLFWASLQGLGDDLPITLDEALSLGAPSAEEEQKRAVLRALKDLEYERAVGKISEEDYASLAAQYRIEAKRLLRVLDEDLSSEREHAEQLLAERLAELGAEGGEQSGGRARKARSAKARAAGEHDVAGGDAAGDGPDDEDAEGEEDDAVHTKSPSSDTAL